MLWEWSVLVGAAFAGNTQKGWGCSASFGEAVDQVCAGEGA